VSELRERLFDYILFQNAFEAASWPGGPGSLRLGYARDGRSMLLSHAIPIDPEVRQIHQVYYYLGLLAGAGLLEPRPWKSPDPRPACSLNVLESDREAARDLLRRHGIEAGELLIGLNPGASYGGAKRWLPDRFAEVADYLARKYASVTSCSAPNGGADHPVCR
jgi:heptosyltransferase-2